VPKTTSKYTVGNIIAVIVCMLVTVGAALWEFFDDPSPRSKYGGSTFYVVLFTMFAAALGWAAIKAIRSRRR